MEIVFDSSTLILLAKIEILRLVTEDIVITISETVRDECLAKETFDSKLISLMIGEKKIKVAKVAHPENVARLCSDFKIHAGEGETLCIAMKRKISLAVDDLLAIKACKILNLRFTTAIHFLLDTAHKGKMDMDTALLKLEKLSFYGRYNKRIINDAWERLKGGV